MSKFSRWVYLIIQMKLVNSSDETVGWVDGGAMGDYDEETIGQKSETTSVGIYTCGYFTKNIIKICMK